MSPSHDHIIDRINQGENVLLCECGERLWPDCDVSAASIMEEFDRHRREVGLKESHEQTP